jgi:hypothetical protein
MLSLQHLDAAMDKELMDVLLSSNQFYEALAFASTAHMLMIIQGERCNN